MHLNKEDNKKNKKDIFYIEVGEFAEQSEYMQNFLKNPPQWLTEVGNEQDQKKHLKERVVIKILERFEFEFDKSIRGFQINLGEEKDVK